MRTMLLSLATLAALGALELIPLNSVNLAAAGTETAAERTQTFAIANMTCALCPLTVKTAMERVAGVRSVRVDFDAKTATVVYDPSIATVETIAEASTNAGYPATFVGQGS